MADRVVLMAQSEFQKNLTINRDYISVLPAKEVKKTMNLKRIYATFRNIVAEEIKN
jgi:nitrogen-specific signal transduction histidine kinase